MTETNIFNLRDKKIEFIKEIVCAYLKHSLEDYQRKTRKREIIKLKYLTIYLILKRVPISLNELGAMFGYDHATVIHAKKQINNYLFFDKDLQKEVDQILALIDHKLIIIDGKLDLDKDYHYFPLNECFAVKTDNENPKKAICFTGYSEAEISEMLTKLDVGSDIIPFSNTNMFLIKKRQEENGENSN